MGEGIAAKHLSRHGAQRTVLEVSAAPLVSGSLMYSAMEIRRGLRIRLQRLTPGIAAKYWLKMFRITAHSKESPCDRIALQGWPTLGRRGRPGAMANASCNNPPGGTARRQLPYLPLAGKPIGMWEFPARSMRWPMSVL